MRLNGFPDELIDTIVQCCYEIKQGNLMDLHGPQVGRFLNRKKLFFIPYAVRTAVWPLSTTSKRIRAICLPRVFQSLLVKNGATQLISSRLDATQRNQLVRYLKHLLKLARIILMK
jgi:hypothetical protein